MKGQVQQVFIYILTMVVVGLILLVGYKGIGGLLSKSCDVEQATFKSNLESFVKKYSSYGSLHKETMKAPCSYVSICFVDSESLGTSILTDNTVIDNSVNDNIEENIFLVKTEVTEPISFMPEVDVDNDFICINNSNGKFHIKFEGLGRETKISSGLTYSEGEGGPGPTTAN